MRVNNRSTSLLDFELGPSLVQVNFICNKLAITLGPVKFLKMVEEKKAGCLEGCCFCLWPILYVSLSLSDNTL